MAYTYLVDGFYLWSGDPERMDAAGMQLAEVDDLTDRVYARLDAKSAQANKRPASKCNPKPVTNAKGVVIRPATFPCGSVCRQKKNCGLSATERKRVQSRLKGSDDREVKLAMIRAERAKRQGQSGTGAVYEATKGALGKQGDGRNEKRKARGEKPKGGSEGTDKIDPELLAAIRDVASFKSIYPVEEKEMRVWEKSLLKALKNLEGKKNVTDKEIDDAVQGVVDDVGTPRADQIRGPLAGFLYTKWLVASREAERKSTARNTTPNFLVALKDMAPSTIKKELERQPLSGFKPIKGIKSLDAKQRPVTFDGYSVPGTDEFVITRIPSEYGDAYNISHAPSDNTALVGGLTLEAAKQMASLLVSNKISANVNLRDFQNAGKHPEFKDAIMALNQIKDKLKLRREPVIPDNNSPSTPQPKPEPVDRAELGIHLESAGVRRKGAKLDAAAMLLQPLREAAVRQKMDIEEMREGVREIAKTLGIPVIVKGENGKDRVNRQFTQFTESLAQSLVTMNTPKDQQRAETKARGAEELRQRREARQAGATGEATPQPEGEKLSTVATPTDIDLQISRTDLEGDLKRHKLGRLKKAQVDEAVSLLAQARSKVKSGSLTSFNDKVDAANGIADALGITDVHPKRGDIVNSVMSGLVMDAPKGTQPPATEKPRWTTQQPEGDWSRKLKDLQAVGESAERKKDEPAPPVSEEKQKALKYQEKLLAHPYLSAFAATKEESKEQIRSRQIAGSRKFIKELLSTHRTKSTITNERAAKVLDKMFGAVSNPGYTGREAADDAKEILKDIGIGPRKNAGTYYSLLKGVEQALLKLGDDHYEIKQSLEPQPDKPVSPKPQPKVGDTVTINGKDYQAWDTPLGTDDEFYDEETDRYYREPVAPEPAGQGGLFGSVSNPDTKEYERKQEEVKTRQQQFEEKRRKEQEEYAARRQREEAEAAEKRRKQEEADREQARLAEIETQKAKGTPLFVAGLAKQGLRRLEEELGKQDIKGFKKQKVTVKQIVGETTTDREVEAYVLPGKEEFAIIKFPGMPKYNLTHTPTGARFVTGQSLDTLKAMVKLFDASGITSGGKPITNVKEEYPEIAEAYRALNEVSDRFNIGRIKPPANFDFGLKAPAPGTPEFSRAEAKVKAEQDAEWKKRNSLEGAPNPRRGFSQSDRDEVSLNLHKKLPKGLAEVVNGFFQDEKGGEEAFEEFVKKNPGSIEIEYPEGSFSVDVRDFPQFLETYDINVVGVTRTGKDGKLIQKFPQAKSKGGKKAPTRYRATVMQKEPTFQKGAGFTKTQQAYIAQSVIEQLPATELNALAKAFADTEDGPLALSNHIKEAGNPSVTLTIPGGGTYKVALAGLPGFLKGAGIDLTKLDDLMKGVKFDSARHNVRLLLLRQLLAHNTADPKFPDLYRTDSKAARYAAGVALAARYQAEEWVQRAWRGDSCRVSCGECLRKHLGSAIVCAHEVENGYPHHDLLVIGHLSEAEQESARENPDLAEGIRQLRRRFQNGGGLRFEDVTQLLEDTLDNPWTVRTDAKEEKTYIAPKVAQENARMGLEMRRQQTESNRCCLPVGLARARDLSNGRPLSLETVQRMANFDRHRQNYKPGHPTKGTQAWLLWGGTEGVDWAKSIVGGS